MKILVIGARFPRSTGKPDSFTVYHMIRFLSRQHDVYLASFVQDDDDRQAVPEMEGLCREVRAVSHSDFWARIGLLARSPNLRPMQVNYYASRAMKRAVDELVEQHAPDVLYCHLMRMAPYVLGHDRPRVLALQISHTLNYQRLLEHTKSWRRRALYGVEYTLVKPYEKKLLRRFDRCLLISPFDRNSLDPDHEVDNIFYSPHGVDTEFFSRDRAPGPAEPEPNTLVFPADFSAATNRDAADWLIGSILPIIREQIPDVHLILAGRNPPAELIKVGENDPGIEVTGYVDDIRSYFKRATVLVDPVRACAGLQNKLLTGFSMEVPVVATRCANEGIQAQENIHLLLTDEDDSRGFAQHVTRLLNEPGLRKELTTNARSFVTEKWTWEYHFKQLESMLSEIAVADGL
jgi:glycosyltransferase involved in cell wall biosynthesis